MRRAALAACALLVQACGGQTMAAAPGTPEPSADTTTPAPDAAPPGALDPGALAFHLSPGDQRAFCDWVASLYGGYGGAVVCDAGQPPVFGPADQDACVNQLSQATGHFPDCPATVADAEACLPWTVQTACTTSPGDAPAACAVVLGPQCAGG